MSGTELQPPFQAHDGSAYDVFISAKSEDYKHAREAAAFLRQAGLRVFFSEQELPELGNADYYEAIDNALEGSWHMLVVTSSPKYVDSQWVKKEWKTFLNEKLAERKSGNLVTLLCGNMTIRDLPLSLRQFEARAASDLTALLRYFQAEKRQPTVVAPTPEIEPAVRQANKPRFPTRVLGSDRRVKSRDSRRPNPLFQQLTSIFGTQNHRQLRKMLPLVREINTFEASLVSFSDIDLRETTRAWKLELSAITDDEQLALRLEEILPKAYGVVKAACRRLCGCEITVRGRPVKWEIIPFDVHLVGGISLHDGKIAEIATGEGKAIAAILPVFLNALTGRGVHVVAADEYVAESDSEWLGAVYKFLGLTVGCVRHEQTPSERRAYYKCDITYGTYTEFGFDYLRDNHMIMHRGNQIQRGHYFAVIDEVDLILIDEARTPLIITGPEADGENQARTVITVENYFHLYKKLAGMTDAVGTDAGELFANYKLDVLAVPTNLPVKRQDADDSVYKTKHEKFNAVINEIADFHNQGRPILVGTVSVETSEQVSTMLKRFGIVHSVLNAANYHQSAEVLARAGQRGSVTIVDEAASRDAVIRLGECVAAIGGLHVIGTERQQSRRGDLHLRGLCALQGEPGSSHFFVSLEDDLIRLSGSDWVAGINEKTVWKEGDELKHSMLNELIEQAQKRSEERNFEQRNSDVDYEKGTARHCTMIYDYFSRGPGNAPKPIRTGPKVGRNDPCPCGSGEKFKHCCGKSG